jgi:hypothetical protein
MSEKPQKRLVIHSNAGRDTVRPIQLVGQEGYIKGIGAKITLFSLSLFVLLAGLAILAASVWFCFQCADCGSVFELAFYVSIGTLCYGRHVFIEAKQIKPVRPVIAHNAYRFSPKEILLRASDVPPSQQQAELLRAARYGKETPAEELLRATTTNGKDT